MRAALAVAISCVTAALPTALWVESSDAVEAVWHRAECPAYPGDTAVMGCAYSPTIDGIVNIYVSPRTPKRLVDDVAWHEYGHFIDFTQLTDGQRMRWLALNSDRRLLRDWRTPPNAPSEQFAESYARCKLGPASSLHTYNYYPSRRTIRRVCKLIGGL